MLQLPCELGESVENVYWFSVLLIVSLTSMEFLTNNLEKVINSMHYHYQFVCQIPNNYSYFAHNFTKNIIMDLSTQQEYVWLSTKKWHGEFNTGLNMKRVY